MNVELWNLVGTLFRASQHFSNQKNFHKYFLLCFNGGLKKSLQFLLSLLIFSYLIMSREKKYWYYFRNCNFYISIIKIFLSYLRMIWMHYGDKMIIFLLFQAWMNSLYCKGDLDDQFWLLRQFVFSYNLFFYFRCHNYNTLNSVAKTIQLDFHHLIKVFYKLRHRKPSSGNPSIPVQT